MEEKNTTLAGISYLVMLLFWLGFLINILIYSETKNKYAKSHAKQASLLGVGAGILLILISESAFAISGSLALIEENSYIGIILIIIFDLFFIILSIMAFKGKEIRFLSEKDADKYWHHWTRGRK